MLTEAIIQASIDKMLSMRKSLEEEREKVQVLEDLITHIQHRIYFTKEFSANVPSSYVSCTEDIESYIQTYMENNKMKQDQLLVKNSVICGYCNEEIQSLFRHDFKMCSCGKTFVDGGVLGYYARIGGDNFKDTSVCCNKDDIACIREHVTWGTYGKSGKEKLKRVLIKDLTTEHIEAILETQLGLSEVLKSIFEMELEYRKGEMKCK